MVNQPGTGILFLVPSLLGDTPVERVIPAENIRIITSLKYFIVEEVRSARRFLRRCDPGLVVDDLRFMVYNEHTTESDLPGYLEPLLNGCDTGLLSEAGMPCVADPGSGIVRLAHEMNIRVRPLSGPSSVLLALASSGFNGQQFAFHGYLPVGRNELVRKIREMETAIYSRDQTQVFIETPYRTFSLFRTLVGTCRDETRLCLAADLTSGNEFIRTRTIREWKKNEPEPVKRPAVFLLYR